jgi:hypothetical protein
MNEMSREELMALPPTIDIATALAPSAADERWPTSWSGAVSSPVGYCGSAEGTSCPLPI